MSDLDALRALVREVIRDVLPNGLAGGRPEVETVNLSTDDDLGAFVRRLLDLAPGEREELRSGRKRFMLASPRTPPGGAGRAGGATTVRRIERGGVAEAVVSDAWQDSHAVLPCPA